MELKFVGGRTSILPQTNKMYRKIEHLLKKVNVWLFSGESIVTYEIVPIFAMSSKAEPIGLGLKGE